MSKWISVHDKMPEDVLNHNGKLMTITVMAFTKRGNRATMMSRCRGNSTSTDWEWSKDGKYRNVTHWQPLPEPPKEGE